jgi:hypothetical protein
VRTTAERARTSAGRAHKGVEKAYTAVEMASTATKRAHGFLEGAERTLFDIGFLLFKIF